MGKVLTIITYTLIAIVITCLIGIGLYFAIEAGLSMQEVLCPDKTPTPTCNCPTITGVGYEVIGGHRLKARVFWNGVEYDTVDEMLEDLGFTGKDLDQQVGGKAMKLMKDYNSLDEIK